MNKIKLFILPLTAIFFLIYGSVAHSTIIGFTDSYEMQNWTGSGTGSNSISPASGPTDTAIFSYNNNQLGFSGAWTFLTTAEETGAVNFTWTWGGLHSWYNATGDLYFRSGSTDTHLQHVSGGGFNVTNSYSGTVTMGDEFGFFITGSNFDSAKIILGDLTVTNFSAPGEPVPEPSTMLLFGAGLVTLAGVARRKRS